MKAFNPFFKIVKCFFCVFCFFALVSPTIAQKSVKGYVYDIETNTPITSVSVVEKNTLRGVETDTKGFFQTEVSSEKAVLIFNIIGYKKLQIAVKKMESILYLTPLVGALDEVVVRGFSSSQLKQVAPDNIYLSQQDIQKLPFILGEKDVIKLIQYTPGVQQASEGQSGLLVRGGNGSMNLTLLDDIYLHNTAHLGGLFSAVNSDFVSSLDFSKAGFDASYGGRLSSVTDIKTLKKTDSTYFNGSIGLLATKLTGNIKLNENNGLLVSGRRTYLEIFKPFSGDNNSILGKKKNYFLYDALAKYTSKLSSKSDLAVEAYFTRDDFLDQTKGRNRRLEWGNFLFGTTFKHQFSEVFSSKSTIAHSSYEFLFSDNEFPFDYRAKSNYNVFNITQSFIWDQPSYLLKLGGAYNLNTTLPKRVNATVDKVPLEIKNQENYKYTDISLFGDIEFPISENLKAKTGLRLTSFLTQKNSLVTDEVLYSVEPRVSLKYAIQDTQALKISYQRLSQFIHQASISALSLPADFFVVSTPEIKPQVNNQISLGYVFEQGSLQLNSALYFKNVSNYTEFQNGAVNNLFTDNVYEDIVVGEFNSYGIELSLSKKMKKLTAQASLTLSNTVAKFDEINRGKYFRTTFDRPINVNTILHYQLTDRIELGALFLFTSGQNYTRPKDIRVVNEQPIINFEAQNTSRYPNYHRLDLSCTYAFKHKGKWNSKLNFTLYNVYNNANPFQIFFQTEGNANDSQIEVNEKRETLFPLLPTINWIFSF